MPMNRVMAAPRDEWTNVIVRYGCLSGAVQALDVQAVKAFLDHGADPNLRFPNNVHYTPLDYLAALKSEKALLIAEMLFQKGADPSVLLVLWEKNFHTPDYTAIYVAMENQNYSFLELCVKYKANLNTPTCKWENSFPLDHADYDSIAREILVRGGAVHSPPDPWDD